MKHAKLKSYYNEDNRDQLMKQGYSIHEKQDNNVK